MVTVAGIIEVTMAMVTKDLTIVNATMVMVIKGLTMVNATTIMVIESATNIAVYKKALLIMR